MKVELSRIENDTLSFDEELAIAPERLDTAQVEGATPVRVVGTIQRSHLGYRLEGRVAGSARLTCDRCLARVEWSFDESFSIELRPATVLTSDDEVGLDADDHYTTARDLAVLARYAMANPTFAEIVGAREYTVRGIVEATGESPGRAYIDEGIRIVYRQLAAALPPLVQQGWLVVDTTALDIAGVVSAVLRQTGVSINS